MGQVASSEESHSLAGGPTQAASGAAAAPSAATASARRVGVEIMA